MAFKLDISKTYDYVNWSFLKLAMHKMCFNSRWIILTMRCVIATMFFVLINEKIQYFIIPKYHFRQGNHLSLIIFFFVLEIYCSFLR